MDIPRFSLKRLLLSVLLISIGLSGVAFSERPGSVLGVTLKPSDDFLADIEPLVRVAAKVLGGTLACLGIILLVVKRRRTRALMLMLGGALVGGLASVVLLPQQTRGVTREEERYQTLVFYSCMSLGTGAGLLLAAVAPSAKQTSAGPKGNNTNNASKETSG